MSKVKRAYLPLLKLETKRVYYLRVASAIFRQTHEVMDVRDVVTGEMQRLVVEVVLGSELRRVYPDQSYVGQCFEIEKLNPKSGKRYSKFRIVEVVVEDENGAAVIESVPQYPEEPRKLWWKQPDDMFRDEWYSNKYLKSSGWKKIKKAVQERDRGLCQRCRGVGTTAHHRHYEDSVMQGADLSGLVWICEGCHNVIHEDDYGHKRDRGEWDAVLMQLDLRRDFPAPKFDARKKIWKQVLPENWDRMNANQRDGWISARDKAHTDRKRGIR